MAAIFVAAACAERPPYLFIEEYGVLSGLARNLLSVRRRKKQRQLQDLRASGRAACPHAAAARWDTAPYRVLQLAQQQRKERRNESKKDCEEDQDD